MNYLNKPQLTKSINGFLNQRKHYFQASNQIHLANLCWQMEVRFDQIRAWDYWRHCLEVTNLKQQLHSILPSKTGSHVKVNEAMIDLILHCQQTCSKSHEQWKQQGRPQLPALEMTYSMDNGFQKSAHHEN
jgi:hypothetical protein